MREHTYNNEEIDDPVADPPIKTKTCAYTIKHELEHAQPKHNPDYQYQKSAARSMEAKRTKLSQLTTKNMQCANKAGGKARAQAITVDQPHGGDNKLTMIKKLFKLQENTHMARRCVKLKYTNVIYGQSRG